MIFTSIFKSCILLKKISLAKAKLINRVVTVKYLLRENGLFFKIFP